MKRPIFIGLFLLLAFCACHGPRREARRMARRAERLFDSMPDSAARLLDSVLRMPVLFSERERMDMALMQGEALFGDRGQEVPPVMDDELDDRVFQTASPDLEHAAGFYARKKRYAEAARAALYSGLVQQHYGEKQIAMQSFKDAARYGKLANDSLTTARAEYWVGRMLYYDGMEQEALTSLKAAEQRLENQYAEKALIQNLIAACYTLQSSYDNSWIWLRRSLDNAERTNCNKVKRKVLNGFAVLYRLQGKHDLAIECLNQIAEETDLNDNAKSMLYLNLGKTFAIQGKTDSAAMYYLLLQDILPDASVKIETRVSAYGALSRFADSQGDKSKALEWREKHGEALFDVMSQQQRQVVYGIQRQYDYEILASSMNRKIIQRHRIILVISILLFISTAIILVLQYRHKQMLEAEQEMRMQIDAMKADLRQTVKSSVMDKEVAVRLRMMLTANRAAKQAKDPKKEWQPLVNQVMNGKESLFDAAQSTVEMAYPNLYAILWERHPNLTETEAKVCLLSFCDLSNAEIAELLGLKPNTVNQNRSTLRKKLDMDFGKMREQMREALAKNA